MWEDDRGKDEVCTTGGCFPGRRWAERGVLSEQYQNAV
jgi:hypothetical protein